MNNVLFQALLAMDVYNRGYNARIDLGNPEQQEHPNP